MGFRGCRGFLVCVPSLCEFVYYSVTVIMRSWHLRNSFQFVIDWFTEWGEMIGLPGGEKERFSCLSREDIVQPLLIYGLVFLFKAKRIIHLHHHFKQCLLSSCLL